MKSRMFISSSVEIKKILIPENEQITHEIRYVIVDGVLWFFSGDVFKAFRITKDTGRKRSQQISWDEKCLATINEYRNNVYCLLNQKGVLRAAFTTKSKASEILACGVMELSKNFLIEQTEKTTRIAIEEEVKERPIPKQPSNVYGIYHNFVNDEGFEDSKLLYVGQSVDPERRFKEHMTARKAVLNHHGMKYIKLAAIPKKDLSYHIIESNVPGEDVNSLEDSLIIGLNPPLNGVRKHD